MGNGTCQPAADISQDLAGDVNRIMKESTYYVVSVIMSMAGGFLIGFAIVDRVPLMHLSSDLSSKKFIIHLIKLMV